MIEIGMLLAGRYRVKKHLGTGGMGMVYLVEDERLCVKRAVKIISRENCEDYDWIRQRLIQEISVLKDLNIPRLPRLYDVLSFSEYMMIIMEYVPGKNLAEYIKENGACKEKYVIDWMCQVTEILVRLHTNTPPIIHRDIKPSNLLLHPDGRIYLIDFGSAKRYRREYSENTTCIGTVGYAAPEQYNKKDCVDQRTDIFGVGMTAYVLLSGKEEYSSDASEKVVCSRELRKCLEKCTRVRKEERFQSAAELLKHLHRLERGYLQERFFFFLLLLFLLWVGGMAWKQNSVVKKHYKVKEYLRLAEQSFSDQEAYVYYEKALRLLPDEESIYQSMLSRTIRPNQFTVQDAAHILMVLEKTGALVILERNNVQAYSRFCYDMGIGYFYQMGGDFGKKEAALWFDYVLEKKEGISKNERRRAECYKRIGSYYKSFLTCGEDRSGESSGQDYVSFFHTLQELTELCAVPDGEEDADHAAIWMATREVVCELSDYVEEFLDTSVITTGMMQFELNRILRVSEKGVSNIEYEMLKNLVDDAGDRIRLVEEKREKDKKSDVDH